MSRWGVISLPTAIPYPKRTHVILTIKCMYSDERGRDVQYRFF